MQMLGFNQATSLLRGSA